MMSPSVMFAFAILFIGVTLSLPLKNNDVDDFVLRANELNRFSPYSENGLSDILEKARLRGRHINPLLYDYYLGALEAAYGRHGDDRSAEIADRREMIKKNFDEIDRTGFKHLKRNFDEIDRVGFSELKRNI